MNHQIHELRVQVEEAKDRETDLMLEKNEISSHNSKLKEELVGKNQLIAEFQARLGDQTDEMEALKTQNERLLAQNKEI